MERAFLECGHDIRLLHEMLVVEQWLYTVDVILMKVPSSKSLGPPVHH